MERNGLIQCEKKPSILLEGASMKNIAALTAMLATTAVFC
jgi:hypothetical protein